MPPDFAHESLHSGLVCGVDEAGRGPLAGPVMAAAVILPRDLPADLAGAINDSKKLTALRREVLFAWLQEVAEIGQGEASVAEIDSLNILQATFLAMRRAVAALPRRPDLALIDGNRLPPQLPCAGRCLVKGDSLSLSIAAASIIAKVSRDRRMEELAARYPGYGWDRNAAYGTAEHLEALRRLGATPEHRRSFAPVRAVLQGECQ